MMWIDVKDKDVVLPSMSKVILVTDGQRHQIITVEKFLETVDAPYNTWTHWMAIPTIEEDSISEEELDKLADIESHKVVNDIYKNFGFQTAAQVVDYLNNLYKAGYRKAKEE